MGEEGLRTTSQAQKEGEQLTSLDTLESSILKLVNYIEAHSADLTTLRRRLQEDMPEDLCNPVEAAMTQDRIQILNNKVLQVIQFVDEVLGLEVKKLNKIL